MIGNLKSCLDLGEAGLSPDLGVAAEARIVGVPADALPAAEQVVGVKLLLDGQEAVVVGTSPEGVDVVGLVDISLATVGTTIGGEGAHGVHSGGHVGESLGQSLGVDLGGVGRVPDDSVEEVPDGVTPDRVDGGVARATRLVRLGDLVGGGSNEKDGPCPANGNVDNGRTTLLGGESRTGDKSGRPRQGDTLLEEKEVGEVLGGLRGVLVGKDLNDVLEGVLLSGDGLEEVDKRLQRLLGLVDGELGVDHAEGEGSVHGKDTTEALVDPSGRVLDENLGKTPLVVGGDVHGDESVKNGLVLVEPVDSSNDNTKGATAATTQGEEDVLVLASVGNDVLAVRQDSVDLLDVVDTHTHGRGKNAVATASEPTTRDTSRGASSTGNLNLISLVGRKPLSLKMLLTR
jgi:hypothetical protein